MSKDLIENIQSGIIKQSTYCELEVRKSEQPLGAELKLGHSQMTSSPSESFPPKTEKNVPKGWRLPGKNVQPEVVKLQQKVDLPFGSPLSSSSIMSKDLIENIQSGIIKQPTRITTKISDGDEQSTPVTSGNTQIISKKPVKFTREYKINYKISQTVQQKFLPKRPDVGCTKGREIKLIINCLDMKVKPMKIFMYDIELIKADMTVNGKVRDEKVRMGKKEMLREIVYEFLKNKGGVPVFDGGRVIFTNQMLEIDNCGDNEFVFPFTKDGETVTCHFKLQRAKEENIDFTNVSNYVESGEGRSDNLPQEALRALDIIIKEMFINKNLISLSRRGIFDPKTSKPLRCGPYLLLDGLATTVRPHMWKIRFNFDKTQVVIQKPMNLYDYIGELTNNFSRFNLEDVRKKIHLMRVEASHFKSIQGKNYTRKYTIHGFSKLDATKEIIEERNITIEKYFMDEYKIKLKYPNRLLIKTSPNKKTYIPMELLTVLPNQKVLSNDPAIVSEVIRFGAIPAFERLDKLRSAIKTFKFGDRADKFIKNYMIEIDENLINVSGRILDGPEAQFGGRPERLHKGKWDFRSKKFFRPAPNKINWALFAVGTERDFQRDEQRLLDVKEQLPASANSVGVKMEPMFHFRYITWQNIEIEVPNIIARSEKEKKRLDLLVFVINRDEHYKAVKRFGDMTFGIATQCMKCANLGRLRQMDQYLSNIMLKINSKLGGINWELMALINKSFSPIKGRFMVFGIDVTHPASNKNDLAQSIAAIVGSLDHSASLYGAVIRQQIAKENRSSVEHVVNAEDMVHKLLMNFYKSNKTLKPDHLIFYRDGVSEGQFEIVFKHEIIEIQNACERLQKDYQPKITYIVVQKRHKIRFFPSNQKDAIGKSGNVPSGTVVDKDITHCREFDFYLCSQEGIQGTSKPAHYHVLFDENNWGSNDLQSFTYFLCHVYARATRSVSYPAPTYYAHLAAFRGRALIGEVFDDSSSVASGTNQHTPNDSEIVIHDYHNNKLFFI